MPGINEHLKQVEHNQKFFHVLQLLSRFFPDWLVTSQFYIAVHLVDAYLATKGVHPTQHRLRGQHLSEDKKLLPIYSEYQDLENLSRDARYAVRYPNRQDLQDCAYSLTTIRSHIRRLLA